MNMSSKGILFIDGQPLPRGTKVEVEVDWPVKLDQRVPLKLAIEGVVVRQANGSVAMLIRHYEFRISKSPDPRTPLNASVT